MLTVSVCHSVHPEYAFTYYSWSLCHSSINRNFPLLAPSQPSLFNNIETFTTASRPLRSWRTFPGWRKHSTTSSAFRTRWRRCPRRRSISKSCNMNMSYWYILCPLLAWKCIGGNISLILGYAMHISLILGYAMHISYKVLIWTSSTKYLDIWSHQRQHHFRCFTNTLLMEGHHHFHGNNCTCETVPANVAELWPFVAQFCIWRNCHFLHHISIFVFMLSCCDEIDIISRAFFELNCVSLALPSCGVPWSN